MPDGATVAVPATVSLTREDLVRRTDALLAELAELWGADGDVILHLFDVPLAKAKALALPIARGGMVTLEVAPEGAAFRTVNVLLAR